MDKKAIECLLEKAQDNESIRNKLKGILYEGGYDDFTVNSGMTRNTITNETNKRMNFANLLISDPETFEIIAKDNVILFHGTNSINLPKIINNGLQSESEIIESGKEVLTGESSSMKSIKRISPRRFISFTDEFDLALDYATLKPSDTSNTKSSFGVLIGISTNDLHGNDNEIRTIRVSSEMPEVGIAKQLPSKYIRVIAVPTSKIEEVRNMTRQYGLEQIKIVPAEGFVNAVALTRSYDRGDLEIPDPNCLIINGDNNTDRIFKQEDVKELTRTRTIGRIKKLYLQLRNKILKKDREIDDVSRDE